MPLSSFTHIYQDNNVSETLVLFHGTGGDEYDLLPLVHSIKKPYNVLSLRGNIREHGMNRFFRRLEFGVFDKDNIATEAAKLKGFIDEFSQKYGVSIKDLTYVGFSNGANMILAFLFLYPAYVEHAVLLHPMLPMRPGAMDLSEKTIAVTYGENDTMISPEQSRDVIETLQKNSAHVHSFSHSGGHEIPAGERSFIASELG